VSFLTASCQASTVLDLNRTQLPERAIMIRRSTSARSLTSLRRVLTGNGVRPVTYLKLRSTG
jgi:hypothetical protein